MGLALTVALCVAMAGCSSIPGASPGATGLAKADNPPVLQLEVDAPAPLAALLSRHLGLARVNRQARGETLNDGEFERLVEMTPAEGRALLETEGYFHADVRAELLPGLPPRVQVRVVPGPRVVIGAVNFQVQGAALADAAAGLPQATVAGRGLREDWPLRAGQPFRDADWSRAKSTTLAGFRAQAYVGATWRDTEARVDLGPNIADLSGTLDSGPLYRAGALRIRGLAHHDSETVQNIANFTPGEPATENFLLDFQERLQRSGLFDRATVTLSDRADDPQQAALNVRVTERPLQDATVGVGISANVGPELTLEHVHRRPFGRALVSRNAFDLAQKRQKWEGELSTHTLPRLYRNLIGGAASREVSDTDTVTSARLRVGRAQETANISRLVFVEAERSLTRSNADGGVTTDSASALSLQAHGIWRKVDDRLSPTSGHVWSGQIGLGQAHSSPGGDGPFTRAYVKLNAYRPLGAWYGQARVELGQVLVQGDVRVPESLRFRAGGDESVRGYAYRSLAPTENGVVVSGKVLFTASVEMARPFLASQPGLMGAVFIDAGRAAQDWKGLRPALGYGVGVRYGSPVGRLKLDLAWGQEVRKLRLHLSVGVPF
jgi:translocation and assembly module TamA